MTGTDDWTYRTWHTVRNLHGLAKTVPIMPCIPKCLVAGYRAQQIAVIPAPSVIHIDATGWPNDGSAGGSVSIPPLMARSRNISGIRQIRVTSRWPDYSDLSCSEAPGSPQRASTCSLGRPTWTECHPRGAGYQGPRVLISGLSHARAVQRFNFPDGRLVVVQSTRR